MAALFITDLHLQPENPTIVSGFLHFLENVACTADSLYILGDLFEVWIGDDDCNPIYRKIINAIRLLVESGVACYFIRGNRDFLIGRRFSQESGVKLLPKEQIIDLYDRKILIMHGDTLCIDDTEYQIFRAKIHSLWIQKVFLSLPLIVRNYIAKKIRTKSQSSNFRKSTSMMNVNIQEVIKVMEKYQVQWLIHGHTHLPNMHKLIVNGQPAFRIVLGAWHNKGSMIKVTSDKIELLYFYYT